MTTLKTSTTERSFLHSIMALLIPLCTLAIALTYDGASTTGALDWAKTNFFDPLRETGHPTLYLIVGNHDIFYQVRALSINSPGLNLREYDNITIIDSPRTVSVRDTNVFMVPWICTGNAERFTQELDATTADISMGHLELAGFYANKDYQCQHGTDPKVFKQFQYGVLWTLS